jgi:hypothetical protein
LKVRKRLQKVLQRPSQTRKTKKEQAKNLKMDQKLRVSNNGDQRRLSRKKLKPTFQNKSPLLQNKMIN